MSALSSLVTKSLLSVVIDGRPRFRMLDTTRSYALSKLAERGDEPATRLRHARHYLAQLTAADAEQGGSATRAEETANLVAELGWAARGAVGAPEAARGRHAP
jgi:predicted ATPase